MSDTLVMLTNGGLAAMSVLAVAAFLQAVWTTRLARRWERTPHGRWWRLATAGRSRRNGSSLPEPDQDAAALQAAARHLAGVDRDWQTVRQHLLQYVEGQDRGARRWLAFLAKGAPLVGLAGTLVGVAGALAGYAADPGSTGTIVEGFAFAVWTTLWGVGIAVLALFASRLLWQPHLERVHAAAERLAADAFARRPARRRSTRSRTAQRRSRKCPSPRPVSRKRTRSI